jgi:hypothetical protein
MIKTIWTFGIQMMGKVSNFQHRNRVRLPIESIEYDCGRTLVRTEHGYPQGKSDTIALNRALASVHTQAN